ncbi:MAG TPA: amino acid adenylation domain-containing protein [Candidatus Angelobacter sp.]|nr:amino acid adenylation domain-containing protein [Candidatus Angelobacter sp.]
MSSWNPNLEGIAIVGVAARLPGANSVAEFWENQKNAVESISHFREDELEVRDKAALAKRPDYIRARSIVQDAEMFDAGFFGIYPREAELMDPQHRVFLECCWEAFEDAGYDPLEIPGAVAVYAGCSMSTYFISQLCSNAQFRNDYTGCYQVGNYPAMMGNGLDFLATRVSYKFNLRGPSFTMVAGCSTSLLAICQGCQSLLTYQADMALAGGASITFPQRRGYLYQEGGMVSSDGHCRAFDADASGTVFGSGSAAVLLKRLEDAVKDGDQIYAVIRGYGMNNDGSAKVGYTAPSIEGQARAIVMAQESSGIDPRSIGYVEAHGTATPLGDPIELAALTQAFGVRTKDKGFCAIGTAKANIGHIDVAAGATGLIHAALCIRDAKLTPTLHFKKPNPKIDFANSPFFVNTTLRDWNHTDGPRRAGVSSFGVGGTNAHVVLEQAPERVSEKPGRPTQLLTISARSEAALTAAAKRLAARLREHPETNLADAAYTLQTGRRKFEHRRIVTASSVADAAAALESGEAKRVMSRKSRNADPKLCFLFPGQGSQQPNMGRELYETEKVFRQEIDRCAKLLEPHLGLDLRKLLYPSEAITDELRDKVTQTILAQPAIFTIEYALAKLWMSWGVQPDFMIGHSVGEFVAACLADVFSLEDGLRLIAARGRLMQALPHGAMLSVRLSEADARKWLTKDLSLAAVNGPTLCVISGPTEKVAELEKQLTSKDVVHRRLHTSHAFHSAMMDPILEPFTAEVKRVVLSAPKLQYVSSVTGEWITPEQATSPEYWAKHFREAVQFSRGVTKFREREDCILLEVGPGNVLATLARQHTPKLADQVVVSSLTDGTTNCSEETAIHLALGSLWLSGVNPNWKAYHSEGRVRVSLPTYPFERQRFWLEETADVTEAMPKVSTQPSSMTMTLNPLPPPTVLLAAAAPEEIAMSQAAENPSQKGARKEKVRAMLAEIFQDLSGVDVLASGGATTFLEMGFDSLFLTQVTQALQSKFSLKVTFRQLLDGQSSLDALATYVDEKLPAGLYEEAAAAAAQVQAAAASVAASPISFAPAAPSGQGTPAASAVEQLLRDQLQAMNQLFAQQLAALHGGMPIPTPPAAIPAVAPAASAKPASAPAPHVGVDGTKELKGYTPFKPLQKSISGDLTPRQEKYIADLTARYTKKTPTSKKMTQEYRGVLADPRVVTGFRAQWKEMIYPIITNKSKGSRLWDIDGNEYVDILNGFGPIMLGHRPDFVEKAIEQQLHEGFEIGPQTLLAGEAAKLICELTGNERATFCNTGSEAVTAAMRVARTVTGRNKIVFFAGDYHGMFDEVLVKGLKKAGEPYAVPVAPGIPREKAANVVVLEYGAADSLEWIRKNANDLAAVMVEPVQSRHPNLQPVSFLKELRQITKDSGSCLIFDEVVTGFRVHPGGCQELFGIRADLATYGKVLAGGMPIGVLAGKAEYMDALDGGMWQFGDDSYPTVGVTFFAGTFVRHPLTMAACLAVLKHLKAQGPELQKKLSARAGEMIKRLNALLEKNHVPTHIENFASFFYFSFPIDFRFGSLFYYSLREKGVHLLENFPCFLTTEHSDADIEKIVRAFEETIHEMQQGELLPLPEERVSTQAVAKPGETRMTEPQKEIFLAAKLGDDASCAFNESFSVYLRGELKIDALRDALNTVIARHEALRATVDPEGELLHFASELMLELPLKDLSGMDLAKKEAEIKKILAADSRASFDLTKGPLLRAELYRLESQRHMLLFTSHHIVCDGWSTNVLLDELSRIYNEKAVGKRDELPKVAHFSEYASTEAIRKSSAEGADVEKYWLAQFTDIPAPLDLPLDRPRPMVKGYAGATYRTKIDAEAYRKIKQLGSKKGCTLFVTLLAGFNALLHRLSNQQDIVVGIPAAGQSLIEDGNLVGHCVNFLPLRARFSEDLAFSSLLGQMKKTLLDAYEHQTYTYGTLVRKLGVPRDPSRLPLMEVQFNLERIGGSSEFAGLNAEVDPNPKSAVNFDLFFNIVESDQGLKIDCDYNTDLFDESTIARWLSHYETMLLGAVPDPEKPVDDLPMMTPAELSSLLAAWNPAPKTSVVTATIHQMFEQQAARTPDAIALTMGAEKMTYRELNERSNQLARILRKEGVKPDSLVAVCFERSLEMMVSFLAVAKSGGAYLPIDSSYPQERLEMILGDAQPTVLVTQERLLANLPKQNAKAICVDRDWPVVDREEKDNLAPASRPEHLAYVIYTSGSTGRPKGVMVTHSNVVRLLTATGAWFHFNETDVWSLFHSYAFDFSVWEMWGALLTGGRLVIVPYLTTRSPQDFYNLLVQENVTVLNQTPAAFYQLIQVEESGYEKPLALRYVIFGGEALNFTNLKPWFERHGDEKPQLVNMYGITETTVHVTYRPLVAADAKGDTRSLIGVPIPDLRVYLLDGKQRPVPPGVVGEIYVGGAGVARGYLNRPELSAERFVPDPFEAGSGSRMYKSGDLARFVNGNDLDYIGRGDTQVKIHGFRIELGEIEALLAQHPGVQQNTIAARKDGPGEKKLVAYFVPKAGAAPTGAELREFLQAKLPVHMVPYAYVQLSALPLTLNGKVDRDKLPAPDLSASIRNREYVAPRTPEETALAGILAEVLKLERVGVTDNLFELGADSLHVFQITSRAAKQGLGVTPRMLLQQRTIAGVVSEMGESKTPVRAPAPEITRVERKKFRVTRDT